ncbi:MAG: sugar phosphate isomerase/epimerase family protein [Schleiferiaceae bacterium]
MKTNTFAAALLGAATLIACKNSTSDTTLEETPKTMETYKKGYQLYTIREEMVSDSAAKAALHATKEMGYVQVESFGYVQGTFFGQSPEQFKKTIDSASLSSPSGHYMPMQLATNEVGPLDTSTIADILDAAEALNQKWVVIPWMSEAWRNAEGYGHLANYLKALSAASQERGMIAAWHNHEFEFQPLEDGTIPYDYLIENLKDEGVVFEMDVHWVAFAGEDPVKWFEKYPGMFPLWHVKDFAADTLTQVPVGQGVIDWERVFANAELSGMQHYYIEQDVCSADRALDCLEESIDWAAEQTFMN